MINLDEDVSNVGGLFSKHREIKMSGLFFLLRNSMQFL